MTAAIPLIVEAAINGATPKAAQPHVPESRDEIVASACACLDAGAAIVHHHNSGEGLFQGRHRSEPYSEAWRAIRARHPDAILYPTMGGGSSYTTIEERYAHVRELVERGELGMSLIDPGSLSIGPVDADGLPAAIDLVYQNTFADVRYMADYCRAQRLPVHISIYEPGFLRVALAYHRAGYFTAGVKIQLYFGGGALPFGLPPTVAGLQAYLAMLDGTGLPWMVGVMGGDVMTPLAAETIRRGGHLRVGLEDYAGDRRPRNEELVAEIAALAASLGRQLATPREAAALLGFRR
jgi:uncharacterized protein (DUF849 family)